MPGLNLVMSRLRQACAPAQARQPADAELLNRYTATRDAAAFELLVWRHSGLVWGVCRRLLRDHAAAEDAFQATFLLLVRKAGSIRRQTALAAWLHRVAVRVALKARQRPTAELPVELHAPALPDAAERGETAIVIDEEVNRLPPRLRAVVVLCYLQGVPTAEAAAALNCPRGTVLSRLSAARRRLHARLSRRGLAPAGILLALPPSAALVASAARAAVVGAAIAPAVSTLTQGVLHAMFITKLKVGTALALTVGLCGTSVGLMPNGSGGQAVAAVQKADDPPKAKKATEDDRLRDAMKRAEAARAEAEEMARMVQVLKAQLAAMQARLQDTEKKMAAVADAEKAVRHKAEFDLNDKRSAEQEKAARLKAEQFRAEAEARAAQEQMKHAAEHEKMRQQKVNELSDMLRQLTNNQTKRQQEVEQAQLELKMRVLQAQDEVKKLERAGDQPDTLLRARRELLKQELEHQSLEKLKFDADPLQQVDRETLIAQLRALKGGATTPEGKLEQRLTNIERELAELKNLLQRQNRGGGSR